MNTRPTERERLLFKLDRLSESEITEVLDYVTLLESDQTNFTNEQSLLFPEVAEDDLIAALGAAYENRRARQVLEWETIRRRADSLASVRHYARP